jgi:putative ABC transport system ATP-binding protein
MAYLAVNNLNKTFTTPGGRQICALSDVSFAVERGRILSIVGHNGSGKTTLLNCIRRAFPFDRGEILIGGSSASDGQRAVVSVFQDVSIGVVPSMTAMENLALVQSGRSSGFLWSLPGRRYRLPIRDFLREADLLERFEAFESTPVSELSGGQRQQLAIVMAMMREPAVLLLDEFVASLDPVVKEEVLSWTKAWVRRKGVTTLMVTHDLGLAETWGDNVLELTDGRVTRFVEAGGVSAGRAP